MEIVFFQINGHWMIWLENMLLNLSMVIHAEFVGKIELTFLQWDITWRQSIFPLMCYTVAASVKKRVERSMHLRVMSANITSPQYLLNKKFAHYLSFYCLCLRDYQQVWRFWSVYWKKWGGVKMLRNLFWIFEPHSERFAESYWSDSFSKYIQLPVSRVQCSPAH